MTDRTERWPEVGAAIEARIHELQWTFAEAERETGISYKTIVGYIAGNPIVRKDKRRDLTAGLRWTPDSVERLLRGEPALKLPEGMTMVEVSEPGDSQPLPTDSGTLRFVTAGELDAVRADIRALRAMVESLTSGADVIPLRRAADTGTPASSPERRARPEPPAEDD